MEKAKQIQESKDNPKTETQVEKNEKNTLANNELSANSSDELLELLSEILDEI
jgi:hypothetical protein